MIALRHFSSFDIDELWVEFGVGKFRRFFPIHKYADMMGNNLCRSLTFWHALTGCDTVSSFNGKGKKTAWKTLRSFQNGLDTFSRYIHLINIINHFKLMNCLQAQIFLFIFQLIQAVGKRNAGRRRYISYRALYNLDV